MKTRLLLLLLAMAGLAAPRSEAATIVQRSGDLNFQCCQFSAYVMTWTQDNTWSNVRIDLDVYNNDLDGATQTGVALLLNSLGPGTTEAANEIDDAILTVSGFGQQTVTIFDGLTLGPGTYHLLYYRVSHEWPDFLALAMNASPDVAVLGPGITLAPDSVEDFNSGAPYRPASPYDILPSNSMLVNITGTPDPIVGAQVPEPSTAGLAFFGLAGFAAWLRRKRC
jgi:hypothetical protein